jgi:type IV secretion system protein VirD4
MAQLFCDVIIKNTGSEKGDHFWDNSELNLLKALVLYVEQENPDSEKNIGEVYNLLTMKTETELNGMFKVLLPEHPAKAPYSIYKQASDTVRSGIIIGLGSRLQVFQNRLIRMITSRDEIDLELPGKQKCAYFCINSDQDSTFDFLSSLFISFLFIKLVRYADKNCEGGKLPVPVHVLGEELPNCGIIQDLSRKISVIRSRNISMSCIFQNLAGLQNRYPYNQWQEILGNCDIQLFLGCTDELTAQFISDRSGEASIMVSSKAKTLGSWRVSDYTPEYRETSGVGRRKLLTMDEVLRLPIDKALVIIRGHKVLQVDKYDYSNHPDAKKLRSVKASDYKPSWQIEAETKAAIVANKPPNPKRSNKQKEQVAPTAPPIAVTQVTPAPDTPQIGETVGTGIAPSTKDAIMSKQTTFF